MTSDEGQRSTHAVPAGPSMLHTVAALRWRRPRLAAELAAQVLDAATDRGDAVTWLQAAGWLLYGRAAVGDARDTALDVLGDLELRAGPDALRRPGAGRLRVELAALAQANGDPDLARDLVDDWTPPAADADRGRVELELDRLAVLVRCALVDGAEELTDLRADVEAIGGRLDGDAAGLVELLLGSVHCDDGEPAAAAERALRGLARLEWTPDDPVSAPRSPHLGCALLSQWTTALLEDGSASDIPDGVKQLTVTDGGRHGVLWRLAAARAFAGRARPTAEVLEDAAAAAAEVDAPSLEAACRSAQAELFETAGRYQEALGAVRAALAAERTDRDRARRLRDALVGPAASVTAGEPFTAAVPADPPSFVGGGPARSSTGGLEHVFPPEHGNSLTGLLADGLSVSRPRPGLTGIESGFASDPGMRSVMDEAWPTPELDDVVAPVDGGDGPSRAAGPAMATLDGGLGDDPAGEPGPAGSDEPGHDVDEPVLPDPIANGYGPGDLHIDPAVDGGSPLADALLVELGSGPSVGSDSDSGSGWGSAPGSNRPETEPTETEPTEADGAAIALDLVDDATRPVDHPDATPVMADLTRRAGRLVPPGSDVRGPDDGTRHGRVTISVPDGGITVARLWARSLVDHLAGRIPRRGLPAGTALVARVIGSAGPVGETFARPLTGPSADGGKRTRRDGSMSDGAAGAPEPDGVRSPATASIAGLEVRPGSGGRRRKGFADDADAPVGSRRDTRESGGAHTEPGTNGAVRPAAAVNGLSRNGSGSNGASGHVVSSRRGVNGVNGAPVPRGWTIEGRADIEPAASGDADLSGGADGRPAAARGTDPAVGYGGSGVIGGPDRRGRHAHDGAEPVAGHGASGAGLSAVNPERNGRRRSAAHQRPAPSPGGSTRSDDTSGAGPGSGRPEPAGELAPVGRADAPATRVDPLDPTVSLDDVRAARPGRSPAPAVDAASHDNAWPPPHEPPRHASGSPAAPITDDGAAPQATPEPDHGPGHESGDGRVRRPDSDADVERDPGEARIGAPGAVGGTTIDGPPAPTLGQGTSVDPAAGTGAATDSAASTDAGTDPAADTVPSAGTASAPTVESASPPPSETTVERPGAPRTAPDTESPAEPDREVARPTPVRRERPRRTAGRRDRNGRTRSTPTNGADPTAIPDDLGLGDLLAGALAAYRDI